MDAQHKKRWGFLPSFQGQPISYLFTCFFPILFGYLFLSSFLFPNSDIINYRPLFYLLPALALGLLLFWLQRPLEKLSAHSFFDKHKHWLIALFLCLLLPFQYLLFKSVYYQPGWDVSILTESGYWLALNMGIPTNYLDYFACYPNNVTLLMIWAYLTKFLIRFFGYYDYLLAAIMVSALIANAALYFVYRCCELFLPSSKALLALLLGIPLVAFAPWMVNSYSDTMTLLFPIFSLFCFLKAETLNSKWQKLILWAACGVSLGFGLMIKPTVFILFIALFLGALLCSPGWSAIKRG